MKSLGTGKLSRKERRELRKQKALAAGLPIPGRKKLAQAETEQDFEPTSFFWIATAKSAEGKVRQVYPTQEQANKYADSLRKRKGFKDISVEKGRPR